MPTVFLDHQASTPVLPEVLEAMKPYFSERSGSPSALHQHGLRARDALAKARAQFARLINAPSSADILFTSGGTESINWAIKGIAWANQRRGKHLVVSAIEHPAVLNSVAFLQEQGFTCTRVGVDAQGLIDPEAVGAALQADTILICAHLANYDVGTIQPLAQIGKLALERGVPLFVDAVAGAGWLPVDVQEMGIALLALSAQRFYGPKGSGILYRQRTTRLASLLHGGAQEGGLRAGTENVPAIVGGGLAAEVAWRDLSIRRAHTARLQERLWKQMSSVAFVRLNGPELGPGRLSTNLNVSAAFTEGEGQLLSLDVAGIAVTSGTSCVNKSMKVSPVLQAMGVDRAQAQGTILISLGKDNTAEEIDYTAAAYTKVIDRLRSLSPAWEEFQQSAPALASTRQAAVARRSPEPSPTPG